MILSMRSSKYHLMTIYSLIECLRLFITPPNSFIEWVYLIWWVISKMMMKILMINLEIIITKTKSIQNTENDGQRFILWILRKFASIKYYWMSEKEWIDGFQSTSFIFDFHSISMNFVKIDELIKIEWSEKLFTFNWSEYPSSQISTLIFIINS